MTKPLILYIHHVGANGGATNSLIDMINGTKTAAERVLIVPHGSAASQFENIFDQVVYVAGIPQFDNSIYGFYRGLRWLILLRELYFFILSFPIFLRFLLLNSHRIKAVHYNDITLVPLALISKMFSLRHIFHVRCLQVANWRQTIIFRLFSNSTFLPIDEYVNETIPANHVSHICRNTFTNYTKSIEAHAFQTQIRSIRHFVILGGEPYRKGIDIALEAIDDLRKALKLDLRVTIFGLPALDSWRIRVLRTISKNYNQCIKIIEQHNFSPWVTFKSFNSDRAQIFENKDAVLFTTRLNAPGRPIIEGCYYHLPSIFCTNYAVQSVFKDVAILCSSNVTAVKEAIESLLKRQENEFLASDFEKIIDLHSPRSQARILTKSYGIEVCEKL